VDNDLFRMLLLLTMEVARKDDDTIVIYNRLKDIYDEITQEK
jgi:hypothetical protein